MASSRTCFPRGVYNRRKQSKGPRQRTHTHIPETSIPRICVHTYTYLLDNAHSSSLLDNAHSSSLLDNAHSSSVLDNAHSSSVLDNALPCIL
jgi:hypothetical protein